MIILILSWIVFGFVVGLIARALLPGRQSMGFLATIGLGVAGSFTGGILASLLFGGRVFSMQPAGWIGSILGALVVLGIFTMMRSRSARVH